MYGLFTDRTMDKLITEYWRYAPKNSSGFLIRSDNFNQKFKRHMIQEIKQSILDPTFKAMNNGNTDQLNALHQLEHDLLTRIDNPKHIMTLSGDWFDPAQINLNQLIRLIKSTRINILHSKYNNDNLKVYGKSARDLLDEDQRLVDLSLGGIGYFEVSLGDVQNMISNGIVTRIDPRLDLQYLVEDPNRIFLIHTSDQVKPYITIAQYDPMTNQLLTPV